MKILYLSVHGILEYDEVKLFHELGYDIFSAGSYAFPKWRHGMPRPGIDGLTHYEELERLASTIMSSGGNIPQELIDWADTVIFMHQPEIIEKNWPKMQGKRVIFRSIGQCVGAQEQILAKLKKDGMQIVRYSPKEERIPGYSGADAMIRFYKDPEVYKGYTGEMPTLINMTQSITQRAEYVQKNEILRVMSGLNHTIYGISNEDIAGGGELTYSEQIRQYQINRAYIYGGTWPAPYTLSFIEALMTGIPIIAVGNRHVERDRGLSFYEIEDIISDGQNGFVSNNLEDLREAAKYLVDNRLEAIRIGALGRQRSIDLFGRDNIAKQWEAFL